MLNSSTWLRVAGAVRWFVAGLACAALGLCPWILHGGHLTLQNLWAAPVTNPDDMPFVFLPFSQYELDLVAATVVVGSTLAGVLARTSRRWEGRIPVVAIGLGLLAGQVLALVQTASTVAAGLEHPGGVARIVDDSTAYLTIVVVWILVAIVSGLAVFALVAWAPRSGVVVGVGLTAVLVGPWIHGLVAPLLDLAPSAVGLRVARWAPAVVAGAAIAWGGVASVRRIIAATAALVILWLGTASLQSLVGAAGSRALLRLPSELAAYITTLLRYELVSTSLQLVVAAAAVAALGLGARWAYARRAPTRRSTPFSAR